MIHPRNPRGTLFLGQLVRDSRATCPRRTLPGASERRAKGSQARGILPAPTEGALLRSAP